MNSRYQWTLLALAWTVGCSTPWISPQSPDDQDEESLVAKVRLVGDVAIPFGRNVIEVDGISLVVGLNGSGSNPADSVYRTQLLEEMRRRDVDHPEQILASPNTALVIVHGYLRPGVQKGQRFDVEVRVPGRSDTVSLRGGHLLPTRLTESVAFASVIRRGSLEAIAQGPVMVEADADDENVTAAKQGRILGGGVALKSHDLSLLLKPKYQKIRYSAWVGHAINRRFHYFSRGVKENAATPETDELIVLRLHPRYKENVPRYLGVILSLPLKESSVQRIARIELLERQLLDPLTTASAALRLEAVGVEGVESLLKGIQSGHAEVKFYSAEALAYLGHEKSSEAAIPLAEAARQEPAFRVFALTALSAMNEFESSEQLRQLLGGDSAETRYGAFRALWAANSNDPLVQGESLGDKFSYHVLNTEGPPMIHATRSYRPEIVLFGQNIEMTPPLLLEAGNEIRINASPEGPITVSRFSVGGVDQRRQVSRRVDDVIRAVVELGGTYPDVVQMLQQASASGGLANCRMEIDAVPQAGRSYKRDQGEPKETSRFTVRNPLPNLFPSFAGKKERPKRPRRASRYRAKKDEGAFSKFFSGVWPW